MQINVNYIDNVFPKNTKRSARLQKKMHIGTHAETIFDVEIIHQTSTIRAFDSLGFIGDWYDQIYDALNSTSVRFETFCTTLGSTSIMAIIPSSEYSEEMAIEAAKEFQFAISQLDPAVANTTKINITVGDAYYGQW